MYPLLYNFRSFYEYFDKRNIELQKLKNENQTLKYKLEGVLIAKNEIYKKYQDLIIKKQIK